MNRHVRHAQHSHIVEKLRAAPQTSAAVLFGTALGAVVVFARTWSAIASVLGDHHGADSSDPPEGSQRRRSTRGNGMT